MTERHLSVQRTARVYTLGEDVPAGDVQEVWIVCHGYGQAARFFLWHFRELVDGRRRIVAPEALSRFYLSHETGRVGATWMTKEDRTHEIDDYVGYLDAIAGLALGDLDRSAVRLGVLGFSQGATTVCRWLERGQTRADRLILWAGNLPHDYDWGARADVLRQTGITFVVGRDDEYISEEHVASVQSLLASHDVPHDVVYFDGGHRLNAEVLRRVMG
ncbi:MAG: phospholipase, partial [Bacteroidota bacterium]